VGGCSTSEQPSHSATVLTGHSPPKQGLSTISGLYNQLTIRAKIDESQWNKWAMLFITRLSGDEHVASNTRLARKTISDSTNDLRRQEDVT
jgi:hypothetical protein